MAKHVNITLNGHPYTLACDDGQESHIAQLAEEVGQRAEQLARGMPKTGETMVLVMTCLMLADELYESRQEAGTLHEHLAMMKAAGIRPAKGSGDRAAAEQAQSVLALAMNEIADHLEQMAVGLEQSSGVTPPARAGNA